MTLDDIKGRTYTSSEEFWRDLERVAVDERARCALQVWALLQAGYSHGALVYELSGLIQKWSKP